MEYAAISDIRQKADVYFYDYLTSAQKESLSFLNNDDEITAYAKKISERFKHFINLYASHEGLVQTLCDIAYEKHGVLPPLNKPSSDLDNAVTITVPLPLQNKISQIYPVTDTDTELKLGFHKITVSVSSVIFRLSDEIWWRRKLRKHYKQKLEAKAIYHGKVHRRKGKYISDDGLVRFKSQKTRNRRILENTTAINELGQEFTLQDLSDKNVSNPELRFNELITRISGFEDTAKSLGHISMFYTITCPSRMHARSSITGKQNLKYDGTTPDHAQKHLVLTWSRIRAALSNMGIRLYGMRVAEPQHDGTPHWPLLVFMPKEHENKVTEAIRKYAMAEDGYETGAKKHRFDAVKMDIENRRATGYIIKYISKNISGRGLDSDIDGGEPITAAERVNAWANHWGIRQFQQLGGPPVSLWREVRRLGNVGLNTVIKEIREAANTPSWGDFVKLLGGPLAKRKELVISLAKERLDRLNQYFEPVGKQIIGITDGLEIIKTRIHTWILKYKSKGTNEKVFEV